MPQYLGVIGTDGKIRDVSDSNGYPVKLVSSSVTESIPVTVVGSTLEEQQTEADATAGVLTFADDFSAIGIENTDASNAGVFTVNGVAINVPAGASFKSSISGTPGATVTVTGATTYIVSRYS